VRTGALFCVLVACLLAGASDAHAAVRNYWVGAVPATWNIIPNGRDAIMNETYPASETVFPTVLYRRFSPHWGRAERNNPTQTTDTDGIPGPLIRARVGDVVLVHFKNMDTAFHRPHSMHFHAFHYAPSSDGAYLPGFSGRDADVRVGQSYTYRLRAGADSVGVWPYHDHSPSMDESIAGGMFGAISIVPRQARLPDREFVMFFSPMGNFEAINGRAFVGNTPIFRSKVGERVQWDVLAIGSEHHTFHVHGHRWRDPDGTPRDTRTLGPAESFHVTWREQDPGTWLYHCHVEDHMMRGMIGIYRVSKR
jgi:FtsP/CotA-like multicopper oxidase with cupredoxin domain